VPLNTYGRLKGENKVMTLRKLTLSISVLAALLMLAAPAKYIKERETIDITC